MVILILYKRKSEATRARIQVRSSHTVFSFCSELGEFWALMERENLKEYFRVLFEVSKLE